MRNLDESALKRVMGSALKVDPGTLGPGSSIETVPGWDSLKHLNLILALEAEFGVSIPDEETTTITSYDLIKTMLEGLLKG